MTNCLVCRKETARSFYKYCSNKCESDDKYNKYIENWKSGVVSGLTGVVAKTTSRHIRRYLMDKYEQKCSLCGWNQINLTTGKVPLEIDHVNGNSEDNSEKNLRLICPNCHSLSSNFRNLNKGKGRVWRKEKYLKVQLS